MYSEDADVVEVEDSMEVISYSDVMDVSRYFEQKGYTDKAIIVS